MKKLEFEPKDFFSVINHGFTVGKNDPCGQYASISNVLTVVRWKFEEWFKTNIESAPVVYSNEGTLTDYWGQTKHKFNTHTARLIDIQEIKPKCEKHIAKFDRQQNIYFCDSCGRELIVEFKEKK